MDKFELIRCSLIHYFDNDNRSYIRNKKWSLAIRRESLKDLAESFVGHDRRLDEFEKMPQQLNLKF